MWRGAARAGKIMRSVAYDRATGKIYVGVGSHAHLIELDPKTGEKKDILPAKYSRFEFCYTVNIVGGKLFALPTNPPEAIVMDPRTHEVEASLPGVQPQQVLSPKSPLDDKIYFNSDGKLAWYDLKTRKVGMSALDETVSILGMTWIDGGRLAIFGRPGRLIIFDPADGTHKDIELDFPPEATPIQSICLGPDGRIYSGGYLSGGLAAYDPGSGGIHEQLGSISQAEGMSVLGSRLYMGNYPHARLTWFDTSRPWNAKQDNPHQFDHLDRVEQDRPIGVLGVKSLDKVFYGTVPDYGKLGGVLAVVDGPSDKVDVYRDVIPKQSIVTLAYAKHLLVGGTAVAGGLGIVPQASEAKLFLWDPAQNKVVYETAPVAGATVLSGFIVGPDGNVWGTGDGTLFAFDVAARKVLFTKKLFDVDPKSRHAGWRDAMLALHPSGQIYGTCSEHLFRVNPATREMTVLRSTDAVLIAIDRAGRVYFRDVTHLWQYTP